MEPLIRNVSDTARWVAAYRAWESERKDAVFSDPFARALAGERGEEIAKEMDAASQRGAQWAIIARTYLIDKIIMERLSEGIDMVINLAAGLDTRPYRMKLPADLKWAELDLPEILEYKAEILKGTKPVCQLERIPVDLSDRANRNEVLNQLAAKANKVLVISEGLLVYLKQEHVIELARDLHEQAKINYWMFDLASVPVLEMLQKSFADKMKQAPMQFAPSNGLEFFHAYGWQTVEVHSQFKTAGKIGRLPLIMKLFSLLPEPKNINSRPWSGVCLMERLDIS